MWGNKIPDKAAFYLEVPALLINWDYEFIDVRDELVTLSFPQSICTFLQKLHQDILKGQEKGKNREVHTSSFITKCDEYKELKKTLQVNISINRLPQDYIYFEECNMF